MVLEATRFDDCSLRPGFAVAAFVVASLAVSCAASPEALSLAVGAELPQRLTDQQFWQLSSSYSEPGGTFHSDNFVSNEGRYQTVIPELLKRARQGGFYVGVGRSRISPTSRPCVRGWRSLSTFDEATCRSTCCTRRSWRCRQTARSSWPALLETATARRGPTSTVEQLFVALQGIPSTTTATAPTFRPYSTG